MRAQHGGQDIWRRPDQNAMAKPPPVSGFVGWMDKV
jgi:hypothetical protein